MARNESQQKKYDRKLAAQAEFDAQIALFIAKGDREKAIAYAEADLAKHEMAVEALGLAIHALKTGVVK